MKRLIISALVLVFLFSLSLFHSWKIGQITGELSAQLEEAERLAETEQWEAAGTLTRKALESWEGSSGYLYIVLRHSDSDQVSIGFQEVLEFIDCQESGEYSAANAALMTQLRLLSEMERLNLKNVL